MSLQVCNFFYGYVCEIRIQFLDAYEMWRGLTKITSLYITFLQIGDLEEIQKGIVHKDTIVLLTHGDTIKPACIINHTDELQNIV